MDFTIPKDIQDLLDECDAFIEAEIKPLEAADDNIRFFDHRREDSRTDWDRDGLPERRMGERCCGEMRRRADAAGLYRYHLPARFGGRDGTNLGMAIAREHLARKGLGLHNDLQNESVHHREPGDGADDGAVRNRGAAGGVGRRRCWRGEARIGFGLTEPKHGSDATWMETTAIRDGDDWVINGEKYWNTGLHHATHDYIFARTSGEPGDGLGASRCFIVPVETPGVRDRSSSCGRSTCPPTTRT